MEAEHVHHSHRRQASSVQLRTLGHASPDEQAAIGAALDGQLLRRGPALLDEPFGRGDEVVEDVLLAELRAGLMPLLAIFAAATNIGNRKHSAHFHPRHSTDTECRRDGNIESSITVKQNRIVAVELQTLFVRDKHRNLRAVV